jgi:hypothetical protein
MSNYEDIPIPGMKAYGICPDCGKEIDGGLQPETPETHGQFCPARNDPVTLLTGFKVIDSVYKPRPVQRVIHSAPATWGCPVKKSKHSHDAKVITKKIQKVHLDIPEVEALDEYEEAAGIYDEEFTKASGSGFPRIRLQDPPWCEMDSPSPPPIPPKKERRPRPSAVAVAVPAAVTRQGRVVNKPDRFKP